MGPGETPEPPAAPRVLLLIKGLGLGGAERLLLDVVRAADAGRVTYEVAFVLAEQTALAPDFVAAGVPVHPLGARSSVDLRWTWALRRLLRRGRFDVLHAHLPYTASFGRLVAMSIPRRRRPALVYTEHSLWDRAAVLTKALNTSTAGADDALLVVSEAARAALPHRLRAGARVVTHGIDRSRFALDAPTRLSTRQAVRAELGVPDTDVVALTVSNVRREKGYDVLLEAARRVAERGSPVRFVTAGRGDLDGELAAAAAEARATGRFTFLGTRTDTARLMTAADIFVLPSHQEGLPVVLMEAMSAGLAVVVTAVGGVPGIVTDGVEGFLVLPATPAPWPTPWCGWPPTSPAPSARSSLTGQERPVRRAPRGTRHRGRLRRVAVAPAGVVSADDRGGG